MDPAAHYEQLDGMVDDPSPPVVAQVVLTAGRWDTKESRKVIEKCIARRPMHEKVFYAVLAATTRDRLADHLATILANPVFQKDPLGADASAWLSRWQQHCIAGTVSIGSPKSFAKLLSIIAMAKADTAVSMLRAISSAIPPDQRERPSAKLVPFESKPEGLTALEQRPEPEIREPLTLVSSMFTWPGLPNYERDASLQALSMNEKERAIFDKGKVIYRELCIACHDPDGRGVKAPQHAGLLAPPLPGSRLEQNREAAIQIMLHGLIGDLDGKKYEGGLMAPFGATNNDEWVASVLTYVRREWGNAGSTILPSDVAFVPERFKDRKNPWTQAELNWKLLGKKGSYKKTQEEETIDATR
jgi:mono/diheme cytochrome c family protein